MYSLSFPHMFTSSQTILLYDHEAISSNLQLLLLSDKTSLLGDPYFGTILKKLLYEQNDQILQDIVIDEIYTCILTFMPQLSLQRRDITLSAHDQSIYVNIRCTYVVSNESSLYTIKLATDEE